MGPPLGAAVRISKQTERRFVLGLQGLWPGRRWKGRDGVRTAIRICRRIQVDPLNVVGHHQDLVLASRISGYRPELLSTALYQDRVAFEFGGTVSIFPRDSLQLQRSWVRREGLPARWEKWGKQNVAVAQRVLTEIDQRGPVCAQDWKEGTRVQDYRSSRIEGLALYYLWRKLDVLIHHREEEVKFYDRTERMFGPFEAPLSGDETIQNLALDTIGWQGLLGRFGIPYLRTPEAGADRPREKRRAILRGLLENGHVKEVHIEREREPSVVRVEDLPLLEEVAGGTVPRGWRPISSEPEAVFIGPLDIIAARDRARGLFDFDYVWEVYKPASRRKWGYYVLPVLLGDRLIGRVEPVVDRSQARLHISQAWWEAGVDLTTIVEPVARGLCSMARSVQAWGVTLGEVGPRSFRESLAREIRRLTR